MTNSISTSNLYSTAIGNALTIEQSWATTQVQQSSGLKAQDFGSLGGADSRELLNLETNIAQSQSWASVAQTTGTTTQSMYNAVGTMVGQINKLQSVISQGMSSPNNSDLQALAQTIMSGLLAEVNQQLGGNYLFAGSNTSLAPANTTYYPAVNAATKTYAPNTADTSYYTGNSTLLSVQVNLQDTVTYGVLGNNKAMEEAIRAVESVIQATQVNSTSTVTAASPTTATAIAGGTLTVNGTNFTITGGQTLNQIVQSINASAGTSGISARVVLDSNGAYRLQANNANGTAMTITDPTGLGLSSVSPLTGAQLVSSLQNSLTISNQAVVDLSNLQQNIGNTSNRLNAAYTQQTNFVTFLQNSLSNVKDADTARTAAQLQQFQTQLQASYLAISSLAKLNLAQYL